ncbi:MAG: RND transporter, partial [Gemmatimonadaceae bacterium]|nr:RND transporter [Gemmatimonadaceae bacterium]
ALSVGSGNAALFKLEADGRTAVRVPVVLGRSSVNTIEIVNGLSEGDRIILSDLGSNANAERIRIK